MQATQSSPLMDLAFDQPFKAPPQRVGGLVLAAGAGRRMGYRPKCLLQLEGLSLLERQLQALSLAGVTPLAVVLGHHAERILQEGVLSRWAAQTVLNPRPDQGHVSSLRMGLQAMPPGLDAVLVALADQPLITASSIQAVLQAFAQRPAGTQLLQPFVEGLPGNPVVFSFSVMAQILAGDTLLGVRQWQQANPDAVYRWTTSDAHFRLDVDNEQDRQQFETLTGQSLRWPDDLNLQP
jgi:molybdenum cofactor cytidylyltransferase